MIHEGLEKVRQKLAYAVEAAGRKSEDVTLIVVSKTFGLENIEPVLQAGQRVFGENRVQESLAKWPQLVDKYDGVELHLIGPLQSNKAADAVALFDVIHTVDRPKLARVLSEEMQHQNRQLQLYIQINTGAESQKAGVLPEQADQFIAQCRTEFGLKIAGLMCIPPVDEEPALHFALLDKIAKRNGISGLSMGMSSDFEIAVQFGATAVRVGSAVFGKRDYKSD